MNNEIEQEILAGNLSKAQSLLEQFEKKIKIEKSEYMKSKQLEILYKYKNLFASKLEVKNIKINKLKVQLNKEHEISKIKNCILLNDLIGETKTFSQKFSDGRIINCEQCTFKNIEIMQTLNIESCDKLVVNVSSRQIRIKNSRNINLYVNNDAGVSLEDSSEIFVFNLNNKGICNVIDFTSPFSTKNFRIIKDA